MLARIKYTANVHLHMNQLEFAKAVAEMASRQEPFAVATVVRTEGSSLGKPGFKMIVSKKGEVVYGTLGGVCPEAPIVDVALETIKNGSPRIIKVHLEDVESSIRGLVRSRSGDEIFVETNCGGKMEIYVEPYVPASRLVIVGHGGKDDVENDLIRFGKLLGFQTTVIDPAPVLSNEPDVLINEANFDLRKFELKDSDYVVILTKGARDLDVLEELSRKPVRFVGLLASRKRVAVDIEGLRGRGVSEDFIRAIHAPVGVDIGAITPSELALSIMADIVGTKYGKHLSHKSMEVSELSES